MLASTLRRVWDLRSDVEWNFGWPAHFSLAVLHDAPMPWTFQALSARPSMVLAFWGVPFGPSAARHLPGQGQSKRLPSTELGT